MELWLLGGGIALALFALTFITWRNSLGRKSRDLEGSNPEMAKALRDAQNQIDKGRAYHF